ncbi:hypothetical protein AOX63_00405 [Pseudomonas sp. ADP]|nr:hypothetical protein [Pseudomonas sp. ADPe]KSW28495.1 hypothetical protein AOX63_00405 [Pseudomonas sp. ADP]OBP12080.1 hypothetical protein BAE52_05960 [Pseudomonas sp. EGD-AKN5]
MMKDAGLSIDALTEEQRQQRADLQREMLRKLGGNDIALILNAFLALLKLMPGIGHCDDA